MLPSRFLTYGLCSPDDARFSFRNSCVPLASHISRYVIDRWRIWKRVCGARRNLVIDVFAREKAMATCLQAWAYIYEWNTMAYCPVYKPAERNGERKKIRRIDYYCISVDVLLSHNNFTKAHSMLGYTKYLLKKSFKFIVWKTKWSWTVSRTKRVLVVIRSH